MKLPNSHFDKARGGALTVVKPEGALGFVRY